MVKKILVDFDNETFEKMIKAKGERTWREVVLEILKIPKKDPNEIIKNIIFEEFEDVKAVAGSYGRRDIFDLIEVLRVIALRCVTDGVDKNKIIDLVDSLIQGGMNENGK